MSCFGLCSEMHIISPRPPKLIHKFSITSKIIFLILRGITHNNLSFYHWYLFLKLKKKSKYSENCSIFQNTKEVGYHHFPIIKILMFDLPSMFFSRDSDLRTSIVRPYVRPSVLP